MIADLKYAFRQFIKSPGFTAVAVITLALGIGANAAVFSVIDTLLLRGLPVRHPEELVVLNRRGFTFSASYPFYRATRRDAKTLSGVVGFSNSLRSMVATGLGRTELISASTTVVSGNFFSFLGVPSGMGRMLTPSDDKPGAPHTVAVVSDGYWKRELGGDPGVIGKTVLIDNVPFSIVGVAPAGFLGVEVGTPTDVWVPLEADQILTPSDSVRFNEATAANHIWIHLMARVRPGIAAATALAELNVINDAELRREGFSDQMLHSLDPKRLTLSPAGSGYVANRETVASVLNVLLLIVGMVLIIACANVTGLLLARSTNRQREFALRAALGAGRRHLARQLLVESMLLAAVAGALGLLFAQWGTLWLARYLPAGDTVSPGIDGQVLAFAAIVSAVTGVLVGLLPIARLSQLSVISAIKNQASTLAGGSGNKLSHVLVASQIAISICLLAGSGLFIRTLQNLRNVDLGFNRSNMALTALLFDPTYSHAQRLKLTRDVWLAVQQLPGVSGVSFSWAGGGLLTNEDWHHDDFAVEGYTQQPGQLPLQAHSSYVGPGFLANFGIPVRRGRDMGYADVFPVEPGRMSADVIIVNEAFAKKFYPHEDPLGHVVQVTSESGNLPLRIIGVAKNTRQWDLREDNAFEFYLPATAMQRVPDVLPPPDLMLQLRTTGNPDGLRSAVHKTVDAIDPRLRTYFYTTLDDVIGDSIFQEKMMAETAGLFSLFALCLASLGLYGVLAYTVARRTREIGVRVALGARASDVVFLILRGGMTVAIAGCAAGAIAAAALAHLIASRLYGVPPLDPLTFLGTIAVLLIVALLACWLPARRATKVDPMIALRSE